MTNLDDIRENIEEKYGGKINSKNRFSVTFSIDINLVKELRKYCEERGQYISWIVEKAIKEYLERK